VTIWEWQDQGLPIKKQGAGTGHEYDTAEVIAWIESASSRAPARRKNRRKRSPLARRHAGARARREAQRLARAGAPGAPLWESRVLAAAFYMQSRHSRLAGMLEASPGIEAKRALLKKEDADFLTKLGVEGERMQAEVDACWNGSAPKMPPPSCEGWPAMTINQGTEVLKRLLREAWASSSAGEDRRRRSGRSSSARSRR
jgi:phage terminase Nu1 subunit (DNA packaging protein)